MIDFELIDKVQDIITLVAIPIATIMLIIIYLRCNQIYKYIKQLKNKKVDK